MKLIKILLFVSVLLEVIIGGLYAVVRVLALPATLVFEAILEKGLWVFGILAITALLALLLLQSRKK